MANINQFVFFDTTSTSQVSNAFGNAGQASALMLQVDTLENESLTINLSVEGAADMNLSSHFFPLKVVGMEDFKAVPTITKAGIYMVVINGLSYVRVKSNISTGIGSFKAYAVSVA